ncbi:MAG: hypothetical protein B7733_03155 [Myxococcales bacterium FL481]|nr:MAG: hypothetical protein B7733_03155 [Myxococcales bacterium FL481]
MAEPATSAAADDTDASDPDDEPAENPTEPTSSATGDDDEPPHPDVLDEPFSAALDCAPCHPVHYEQWKASMHAFGGSDPVMLAMRELAIAEAGSSEISGECLACHAPALSRLERLGLADSVQADRVRHDGVNCDVCHSIATHPPPVADIEFLDQVDPRVAKRGRIDQPVATPAHESAFESGLGRSGFCAPCHQVNFDDGRPLENTFNEWQASSFGEQGVSCQACHMPSSQGPAADGGPTRRLHDHTFPAIDYALEPFLGVDVQVQKEAVAKVLRGSLSFFVLNVPTQLGAGEPLEFVAQVRNAGAGHAIPSGTSFARELWASVRVYDADGIELYASGQLDESGDLVRDEDLLRIGATLYDANGDETPFSWRAVRIDDSGLLGVKAARDQAYRIPVPDDVAFPLTLIATLHLRPISPGVVRELGLERLLPIEVFDIWQHEREIGPATRR